MHGHAWTWGAVGMFLLGLGALAPPSAEACAAPNCLIDVRFPLPEDGGTVPANVPGLVVRPPLLESTDVSTLKLLQADGTPVPFTLANGGRTTHVLVPKTPLVPGTQYRIEAKGICQYRETQTQSAAFTAGPELPLPTTLGTLSVDASSRGEFPVYGDSNCGSTQEGDSTELRFTPSPELVPFLPWVRWEVEVDGQPWSFSNHHGLTATGTDNYESHRYEYNRPLLFLYTVCTPYNPAPPGLGLTPGRHQATLKGTLERANLTLPPLSVDFELSCATQSVDAGTPDGGSTGDDGGTPNKEPTPSKGGCTQTGGGLTVLGLLATLRLWRGRLFRASAGEP
ncbi:hypothetical protein [Corallococcus aberystwythensis]|uniref:SbsA Ig-like domain-containing protein n=1 Tax=Corallococcus aberystwythensis TaxID=2316722 RepID=A0A3A8QM65_9BACT|nr:hypothetical protein [Corallococcus aberystwythensis]RKH67455.1 hypothetical protein D7W81_13860 [Corallococcus aberystwythensis]